MPEEQPLVVQVIYPVDVPQVPPVLLQRHQPQTMVPLTSTPQVGEVGPLDLSIHRVVTRTLGRDGVRTDAGVPVHVFPVLDVPTRNRSPRSTSRRRPPLPFRTRDERRTPPPEGRVCRFLPLRLVLTYSPERDGSNPRGIPDGPGLRDVFPLRGS